ncbi:MAG: hydroxymethylbilane synthase [Solirubrobacteraceae bacterium]
MRIGTRGSALALAQAESVARLLDGAEIEVIATSGDAASAGAAADTATDRGTATAGETVPAGDAASGGARPPAALADKSRWVDAIERALLDGRVDLAVHSAKDLPGELPDGLSLLGTLSRAPVEDVLCGASDVRELAPGARVGTSSLRRRAQLLALRPDVRVVPLAGNVDTRLARLRDGAGSLDAIVLARAGLSRLGLEERTLASSLPLERFVPSPGQGALALEGRAEDRDLAAAVAAICDERALACLRAERALATELGADCHTPFGAHAWMEEAGALTLRCWTGLPDGSEWILDEVAGEPGERGERLGARVAERMSAAGARELIVAAAEAVA